MRLLPLTILFAFTPILRAEPPLKEAEAAFQKRDYKAAVEWATKAAAADPKDPEPQFLLGSAHLSLRELKPAVEAFTLVLKLKPDAYAAYDRRGDAYLKLGLWKEAIADFDAFLKENPKFAPEHWRRGIALYYAGRYEDGVKQFETHKTVNPEDVENAAWHYLCNTKVVGSKKAQAALIDVTRDTRVPMAEIQKLFAGKSKPEDVLAASEKTDAKKAAGISARFYGHLYVALWYDAEGDAKKVLEHLEKAVKDYKIGDYMWDVGNAHLQMLTAKKK